MFGDGAADAACIIKSENESTGSSFASVVRTQEGDELIFFIILGVRKLTDCLERASWDLAPDNNLRVRVIGLRY